ncbi:MULTISPECIES: dethiobiotin synthase [Methylosinus]|uniref:ATP-dependent dethiobiotin synthetase BioD n=1 Tax=Methylosinus trichosporium (strain ATCC 35070 / NCIMB 11131 / UNIQEM 75 / OB3b) TaxID=595536 RepID=A0A2D2CVU7_METT3|nr:MULTISPECIES: dethiobiotin synthase [Methylosinus]ATQ66776.1 ATP-dependent dethiobiotin synthetase BioD [Methylosinus trichosporium OB3b]OBS50389.1 dethiobiotin synthase [Methylosinus sp. 3S-1]
MTRLVVVGTDTDVGKTVFSAALAGALGAYYWKPVQAGLDSETDTQTVARLSGLARERLLSEAYVLRTPASPHLSARLDGVTIDVARLAPPALSPLVVETAGGLMTPLTETLPTADLLAQWRLPVVLCARTTLGTINHSLLSLEALRRRDIPVLGVAFIGEENVETRRIIAQMSDARDLGRLPLLAALTADVLRASFESAFRRADFSGDGA